LGYLNTNKLVALSIISFVIVLFIWKFDPVLGGGYTFIQKIVITLGGIIIPGFIIWNRE